jgi:hypothetical protein
MRRAAFAVVSQGELNALSPYSALSPRAVSFEAPRLALAAAHATGKRVDFDMRGDGATTADCV